MKLNDTIKSFFGVVLCRLLFDLCYCYVLVPNYAYSGFIIAAKRVDYVISWFMLLFATPIIAHLNARANKFSDFVILFMSLLAFVPFTTMVGLYGFSLDFIVYSIVFWFSLYVCHILLNLKDEAKFKFVGIRVSQKHVQTICLACILLAVCVILYVSGYYRHFAVCFNLNKVYEIRAKAAQFGLSRLLSYILSMSSVVVLLFLLYALYIKKYMFAVFLFVIQIINFGIAAHKSILFELILAITIYVFYNRFFKKHFVCYMNVLLCVSVVEFCVLHSYKLAAYILRRACFVTNRLSYEYFDFFTTHQPDYFAQSFLRHFGIVSKYPPIPYMIGEIYYNAPEMAGNNGLVADAITNYGVLGAVVLPLVLNILLYMYDKATENIPPKLYIAVAVLVAAYLQNTFLFTCLLTHGFIVMLLCLWVISKSIMRRKDIMLHAENVR